MSLIVAGATLLMLADGAGSLLLRPPPPPVAPAPPASAASPADLWLDIPKPLQLYGLSGSVFARQPLAYAAQRRATGFERKDVLVFGAFGSTTPYLRLVMERVSPTPAPAPPADLLVDFARTAAAGGLAVTRIGLPLNLSTRFGLFDTADITLERGDVALPCLGFRLGGSAGGPVRMTGMACGGDGKPLDRGVLDCVIDRIDLISAGDDHELREVFVAAERRRVGGCAPLRRRTAAVP